MHVEVGAACCYSHLAASHYISECLGHVPIIIHVYTRCKNGILEAKNVLPKIKKDLVMACHILQPLEKAKKQRECH